MTLTVAVFGQRSFGAAAAHAIAAAGHTVTAAVSPATQPTRHAGDRPDPLHAWTHAAHVPWTDADTYTAAQLPDVDVIIAAHSHNYLGRRTRARARIAALGYHPSLLPLHRGRDAVRWTIRDRDRVTGGTVYHLTDNVDAGPIAAQDYALVPPDATPASLWRDVLFPMGVRLIVEALANADADRLAYVPQDEALATWEPARDGQPLHRPELLELGGPSCRR